MGFRIINGRAYPIHNIESSNNNTRSEKNTGNNSFKDVLNSVKEQSNEYKVSKHAADRLRSINFTQEDMDKIGEGFKIAQDKGSKSSLMVYKDVALVASIENKTLITAVEKDRAESNVFTNIDSVVFL